MLVIAGTDRLGIRTAARLFPQLTGVAAPDWGKYIHMSPLHRRSSRVCTPTVVTGSDNKGHEIMAAGYGYSIEEDFYLDSDARFVMAAGSGLQPGAGVKPCHTLNDASEGGSYRRKPFQIDISLLL